MDDFARDGWKAATHGVLINSALVLFMTFAAAMVWGYRDVAALTIVATGATYLSYLAQIWVSSVRATLAAVAASILLGTGAIGLLLVHLFVR